MALLAVLVAALFPAMLAAAASPATTLLDGLPTGGIFVLLDPQPAELAILLAGRRERLIYCPLPADAQVAATRQRVDEAGLLGTRIYVEKGPWNHIHLADNLADAVIVTSQAASAEHLEREELLRVVNPLGKILLGDEQLTKPFPPGTDDWTHPYHGPDNNPQSRDQVARAPYLTQYFAGPYFAPPPGVSVAAGGRLFKAYGHLAFHAREWPWRNKLMALNAFNGTILWTRPLEEGFNIHRNTLIATAATLYLADSASCKMLDAATGAPQGEIAAPDGAAGPVWKWIAMEGDVLYALVGQQEFFDPGHQQAASPPGWPWPGMSPGYDLAQYPWGFGRTFFAVNVKTKKILWVHHESEKIDSRGVCMKNGRIYYYSEQKFFACLGATAGKPVWRTADDQLLNTIGPTGRAQSWTSGMSTFSYVMCSDRAVYFVGPQRQQLVAVSAADGRLLWHYPFGNFRPVLREEGLYALSSPVGNQDSLLLDPLTGETLAQLGCRRGNCTRPTGTVDAIFCRAENDWGTGRLRAADRRFQRIAPMRPPCHDGVITTAGLMHWGTWICDCNVSLIGNITLAPAGDFDFQQPAREADRLQSSAATAATGGRLGRADASTDERDWPTFRADNAGSAAVPVKLAAPPGLAWTYAPPAVVEPAAPIAAYGTLFSAGADGVIRALDAANGKLKWSAYTAGPILFPPVAYGRRLYAGSGDGWVYCFDAEGGRPCWRFRAAPVERKIPVYGRLCSTWPVGSGVLVEQGVVYAAAGLANYDGTHVYALDADTGKIRWQNNTSGSLGETDSLVGVSVQGHLLLDAGKLYLAGGNAVSPAVYDAHDGRCLSEIAPQLKGHSSPRGQDLFLVQDRVCCFDRRLYGPNRYWPGRGSLEPLVLAERGETVIRDLRSPPMPYGQLLSRAQRGETTPREPGGRVARVAVESALEKKPKVLWQSDHLRQTYAVALGLDAAVVAGELSAADDQAVPQYAVAALSVDDGRVLWSRRLPGQPAWWGLAVGKTGRIFVSLLDGRVLCFAPS